MISFSGKHFHKFSNWINMTSNFSGIRQVRSSCEHFPMYDACKWTLAISSPVTRIILSFWNYNNIFFSNLILNFSFLMFDDIFLSHIFFVCSMFWLTIVNRFKNQQREHFVENLWKYKIIKNFDCRASNEHKNDKNHHQHVTRLIWELQLRYEREGKMNFDECFHKFELRVGISLSHEIILTCSNTRENIFRLLTTPQN